MIRCSPAQKLLPADCGNRPLLRNKARIFHHQGIVKAWNNAPYVSGAKHIANIILTNIPYQEKLMDMPESDLLAEGGLWATKDEFICCVCRGKPNPDLVVWVCCYAAKFNKQRHLYFLSFVPI